MPDERQAEANPAQVTFYQCGCIYLILPQSKDIQTCSIICVVNVFTVSMLLYVLLFRINAVTASFIDSFKPNFKG